MSAIALQPSPPSRQSAAHAGDSAVDQRRAMIDCQLRTSDVTDPAVVSAMGQIPREAFLPESQAAMAYIDRAIPLGGGRSMNAPLATGRLLVAAELSRGDRVLLVGAASGYTAAVLAAMGMSVVALEDNAALAASARASLASDSAVTLVEAPLTGGAPEFAPFDAIIIDGAVAAIPAELAAQLRPGGTLVCGLTDGAVTRLARGVQVAGMVVPVAFADVGCAVLPQFLPSPQFTF